MGKYALLPIDFLFLRKF